MLAPAKPLALPQSSWDRPSRLEHPTAGGAGPWRLEPGREPLASPWGHPGKGWAEGCAHPLHPCPITPPTPGWRPAARTRRHRDSSPRETPAGPSSPSPPPAARLAPRASRSLCSCCPSARPPGHNLLAPRGARGEVGTPARSAPGRGAGWRRSSCRRTSCTPARWRWHGGFAGKPPGRTAAWPWESVVPAGRWPGGSGGHSCSRPQLWGRGREHRCRRAGGQHHSAAAPWNAASHPAPPVPWRSSPAGPASPAPPPQPPAGPHRPWLCKSLWLSGRLHEGRMKTRRGCPPLASSPPPRAAGTESLSPCVPRPPGAGGCFAAGPPAPLAACAPCRCPVVGGLWGTWGVGGEPRCGSPPAPAPQNPPPGRSSPGGGVNPGGLHCPHSLPETSVGGGGGGCACLLLATSPPRAAGSPRGWAGAVAAPGKHPWDHRLSLASRRRPGRRRGPGGHQCCSAPRAGVSSRRRWSVDAHCGCSSPRWCGWPPPVSCPHWPLTPSPWLPAASSTH